MIFVRTTLKVYPEKQLEVLQTLLSLIKPVREEPA
ncbi:MAG: antibiotic biosynthesis monooxygenase, partial [Desulfobacula sp.]|nr:antibiotic biosynthesis monooxygenase [Desulfobacula sp.]